MTDVNRIKSMEISFESDMGASQSMTGKVAVLEYQDSGVIELPGMIETQLWITSYPLSSLPAFVLTQVQVQVNEDSKQPRVFHKAGLNDFSTVPIFKSSPRIYIAPEKRAPLIMRVEWRLIFTHTGSGKRKVLKVFGKWDVIEVNKSTLDTSESDLP